MLKVEFSLETHDPRFIAVLTAIIAAAAPVKEAPPVVENPPVVEAPVKAAKTKAPIEKPAPEVVETQPETATDDKPVTLEAIREKITEYTGKDKAAYTPKIKALLDKYGQKSASNLLKTDYEAFYTDLKLL